jgi:sugar phosphate isomerase/epimerase
MKFGFPVIFRHGSIFNGITIAGNLSFDFVDIIIDTPTWLDEDTEKILEVLEEYSLEAGVQSPWETIYLYSPWEGVRKGCHDTILSVASFASRIKSEYFNIHIQTDAGSFEEENVTSSRIAKTLKEMGKEIKRVGKITVENCNNGIFSNLGTYAKVIDNSSLFSCMDIGHVLESNQGRMEALVDWVSRLNDEIYTAHLSVARIREKNWFGHYKPTVQELGFITNQLKRCKSLKYLVFEFFRNYSTENDKNREMKQMLDFLKKGS